MKGTHNAPPLINNSKHSWKNFGKNTKLKGTHNGKSKDENYIYVERTSVKIPNWKELTTYNMEYVDEIKLKELR